MIHLRMIFLLSVLNVGLASAATLADTNQMPQSVHALMDATGHAVATTNRVLAPPDTNSLRNLPPLKNTRLRLSKPTPRKSSWSFWDNAHVKYIGANRDLLNYLAPAHLASYSALAQFEYDFVYSFDF
jgi:hypothetical protein